VCRPRRARTSTSTSGSSAARGGVGRLRARRLDRPRLAQLARQRTAASNESDPGCAPDDDARQTRHALSPVFNPTGRFAYGRGRFDGTLVVAWARRPGRRARLAEIPAPDGLPRRRTGWRSRTARRPQRASSSSTGPRDRGPTGRRVYASSANRGADGVSRRPVRRRSTSRSPEAAAGAVRRRRPVAERPPPPAGAAHPRRRGRRRTPIPELADLPAAQADRPDHNESRGLRAAGAAARRRALRHARCSGIVRRLREVEGASCTAWRAKRVVTLKKAGRQARHPARERQEPEAAERPRQPLSSSGHGPHSALRRTLTLTPANERRGVYLVGAGPGDPRADDEARAGADREARDAILYDRLIPPGAARRAPRAPDRPTWRYVGKQPGGDSLDQSEINALLVELRARRADGSLRLKGGDPVRVWGAAARRRRPWPPPAFRSRSFPAVTAGRGRAGLRWHPGHPSRRTRRRSR